MMRGRETYATAVRRRDGSVVVEKRRVPHFLEGWRWTKLPLIRGTFMLIETLTLGFRSLQFSANVALDDEAQAAAEEPQAQAPTEHRRPWVTALLVAAIGALLVWRVAPRLAALASARTHWFAGPDQAVLAARVAIGALALLLVGMLLLGKPRSSGEQPQTLDDTTLWLAMMPAMLFGVALFVLFPSYIAGLGHLGKGFGPAMLKNVIEGVLRLGLILGYIGLISLMKNIRRVFQYHGAEHKVINGLEMEGRADPETAATQSPLHPRCGTAFLLLFIVLKIIVGWFFGWPALAWRLLLRLAMVPVVAALAYETTRLAGRYRHSLLARALSGPGLLLQRMTTREPEPSMIEVALYALAGVAPEVSLPVGWAPAAEYVRREAAPREPAEEGERT
jgi:uncharacterized protein YqhQ